MRGFTKAGPLSTRRRALFAGAVFILAQFLSVAHLHPVAGQHNYSASAATSAEDGLCPVCLLYLHAPSVSSAAPSLGVALLSEPLPLTLAQPRLLSSYRSRLFSRAPPTSV